FSLGLFLVVLGAVVTGPSRARGAGPGTPEAIGARGNLGLVWGPLAGHWGMFFLVFGLLAAAVFMEDIDVFARLFLIILGFLALLLILASSTTIFGVP